MNGTAVRRTLSRGDVVAAVPLAPGFPCWLPHGTSLVDRVEEIVRASVDAHAARLGMDPFLDLDVELAFAAQPYCRQISETLEYRNMYALQGGPHLGLSDGEHLVRPDNVLSATRFLRGRARPTGVICAGSLWRADTQRMAPAVRDRHMWQAVELLAAVPHGSDAGPGVPALLHAMWQVLGDVADAIGLPQIYYASPGLRDHSDRCLLSLSVPTPETLTLTSTLFLLSRAMSDRFGIGATLVDLGFTAKLLALALIATEDRHGLLLTSALAPDQVVVVPARAEDEPRAHAVAAALRRHLDRVRVDTEAWSTVLRTQRRRGTPALVLVDGAGRDKLVLRHTQLSVDLAADPAAQVRDALVASDADLRARSRAVLDAALRDEQVVALAEPERPVPDGWYRLGHLCGIGGVPSDVDPPADAPQVLARVRRLY
ncbi:MAG: hypothetical protein U0Q15_03500 [Kineosporiaceae bacterium]